MYYEQAEFEIRCEWGLAGITHLAPVSDVVIIVDVLSFSTCVDVAVSRGAFVYPFRWKDSTSEEFAAKIGALVASTRRSRTGFSLSPVSLEAIPPGTKLVLPSPNGSALSLSTGGKPTLAGCLRNASAVASAAELLGKRILVVPAGEHWPDGTFRPAIEDLLGAGALIGRLGGLKSPEAMVAEKAFASTEQQLAETLRSCSSGKQLIERGYSDDVELAAEFDVSRSIPILVDEAYRRSV